MKDSDVALVVEDDAGMRGLLASWVRESGYQPLPAATAEEALRHLERTPPAVALCDVGLPDQDGLWLAAAIQAQSPETAVILATGRRDPAVRAAVARALALDCLLKPFDVERLREALESARCWRAASQGRLAAGAARHGALPAARLNSGHQLVVENISPGGALVVSPTRLFPGTEVSVKFLAPEWERHTRARVARCDVASVGATGVKYRAGLEFIAGPPGRQP